MDSNARPDPPQYNRTARIKVTPAADASRPRLPDPDVSLEKTILMRDVAANRERIFDSAEDHPQDDLFQYYTILGKIGDGGMGVVYLAKDKRLGRFVSIKRLNAQGQCVPSLRQRFLQEARAVAALTHIHIVHIYALGEDRDGPYIVMEYIAGPDDKAATGRPAETDRPSPPLTLDQLVARNGQLAVAEAVELIIKVGRAVSYAHSCGVIHRDLKPGNVLLDKSNEPKIVDFGLARLMRSEESKLTVPGEKLLSLGYGAPEQEQDASLSDERADVYGLGALLYFALTGQNPRYFREQDIPVPFRDVLVKALATDREQRFPSAAAFTDALQATQNKTHVEIPTVKTTWRCKWCDTVNPLSLRYCAECGWDGGETCPECGVETFVGVQFCGSCGADARSYEALLHVLMRMRAAMEARLFDRVLALGGRVHGFEAAGPSGRHLQKEAQELREQAERNLARRDELREQIPIELRAENFERAISFIREMRTLDENQRLYEEEERRIPEQTLARDLGRARRAIRAREWDTAARLCDEILRRFSPESPEALRMRREIAVHHGLVQTGWIAAAAMGLVILYLLSLPPIARHANVPMAAVLRNAYRPALTCYAGGPFAGLLTHYKALWGCTNLMASFDATPPPSHTEPPAISAELQRMQTEFNKQTQKINAEQSRDADKWQQDYLGDLNALAERRRNDGDFDGWSTIAEAIKQFATNNLIANPPHTGMALPELTQLNEKYREIIANQRYNIATQCLDRCSRRIAAIKGYATDLINLQRSLTRDGKMDAAAEVNAEIRELSGKQRDAEDEQAKAKATAAALTPVDPVQVAKLLTLLRARYQTQIDVSASNHEARVKLWPAQYKAAITNLMAAFQKEGIYDDWDKANKELNRFEAEPQIKTGDVVTQSARLAKIQQDQIKAVADYKTNHAKERIAAANELIAKLEEQQRKYTKEGNMAWASAMNAEIKQTRNRPEYLSAKLDLEPPPPASTNTPPGVAGSVGGK